MHNIQLQDLRVIHLQTIINHLAKNGYGTRTLTHIKQVACQVIRLAEDNDIVGRNVFERVKIPSIEPTKRQPLTEKQMALAKATYKEHRMGVPVMLMMYAGLRRGEVLALTWRDVDFENRIIHVHEAIAFESNNVGHRKAPKTAAGTRDVPILAPLLPILKEAKQETESFLVCPAAEGGEMTNMAWRCAWRSYMHFLNIYAGGRDATRSHPKVIAMEPFTAHQLRHTFITLCHEADIDPKVTQEIVGHADISTTLNIYTHLTQAKKEEAIETLNEHLTRKPKKKRDEMER